MRKVNDMCVCVCVCVHTPELGDALRLTVAGCKKRRIQLEEKTDESATQRQKGGKQDESIGVQSAFSLKPGPSLRILVTAHGGAEKETGSDVFGLISDGVWRE